MKQFLVVFSASILFSCNGKLPEKESKEIFVISKYNSDNKEFVVREENYYSKFNLILGDSNKVYFFKYYNHSAMNCIPSDNPPHFLDIKPSDLILLPFEDIDKFIEVNNDDRNTFDRSIYNIASPDDSIQSKAFKKIMKGFAIVKQKKYIVRRTTMEEDSVLYYKVNNLAYDSDKIKWDTTKVNLRDRIKIEPVLNKKNPKR